MKTSTVATALLALSSSALAYQVQFKSAPNCGGSVLREEGRAIGDGNTAVPTHLLPESMVIKLGDGENNGATVKVLFSDAQYERDHYQEGKIGAGDHSWRCFSSDDGSQPHPWGYSFV